MGLKWIQAWRQTEEITGEKIKKWAAESARGSEDNACDDARSTTHDVGCHLHIPRAQTAAEGVEK